MLTDLVLAIAHHLLMFSLLAVLVMELMLVRPAITAEGIRRVGRLDLGYGAIAGLILVVGFARVFFGLKGPEYYLPNPFFWAKIAAFLIVGLLSVPPTMRLIGWRSRLRQEPAWTPSLDEVKNVRWFMHMEAVVFILIPVFAALMARYS